jgi:phage FluMu protein Com
MKVDRPITALIEAKCPKCGYLNHFIDPKERESASEEKESAR